MKPFEYSLLAISGFMGLSSDWDPFDLPSLTAFSPSDFETASLSQWGFIFNEHVQSSRLPNPILLGYSFGARLGLHALIANPACWTRAIIVSAHPGLVCPQKRAIRFREDQEWALRFRFDNWAALLDQWNHRLVLSTGKSVFQRQEKDYNRNVLARQLCWGSLGMQEDLRDKISALPMPILWLTGENDSVYTNLAKELVFQHPESRHIIVPQAGHRVIWDQPALFQHHLKKFCDSSKKNEPQKIS